MVLHTYSSSTQKAKARSEFQDSQGCWDREGGHVTGGADRSAAAESFACTVLALGSRFHLPVLQEQNKNTVPLFALVRMCDTEWSDTGKNSRNIQCGCAGTVLSRLRDSPDAGEVSHSLPFNSLTYINFVFKLNLT